MPLNAISRQLEANLCSPARALLSVAKKYGAGRVPTLPPPPCTRVWESRCKHTRSRVMVDIGTTLVGVTLQSNTRSI